jgi:hypothetical protein
VSLLQGSLQTSCAAAASVLKRWHRAATCQPPHDMRALEDLRVCGCKQLASDFLHSSSATFLPFAMSRARRARGDHV